MMHCGKVVCDIKTLFLKIDFIASAYEITCMTNKPWSLLAASDDYSVFPNVLSDTTPVAVGGRINERRADALPVYSSP
jgi:hypothetical protein